MDSELYRIAAEQTSDYAVFLLDATGRILTWNLGAQRIKGYAPDESSAGTSRFSIRGT